MELCGIAFKTKGNDTMENITDKNTVLGSIKMPHAAKCRNTSGESIMCHFTIDYTGCTLNEVLLKAVSSDTISGQRAWEKMTPEELSEKVNGKTFHARTIGRKVKSDAEVKAEFKARYNSYTPEQKRAMIAEMQAEMDKE